MELSLACFYLINKMYFWFKSFYTLKIGLLKNSHSLNEPTLAVMCS